MGPYNIIIISPNETGILSPLLGIFKELCVICDNTSARDIADNNDIVTLIINMY